MIFDYFSFVSGAWFMAAMFMVLGMVDSTHFKNRGLKAIKLANAKLKEVKETYEQAIKDDNRPMQEGCTRRAAELERIDLHAAARSWFRSVESFFPEGPILPVMPVEPPKTVKKKLTKKTKSNL